ncbi:MAG TPA: VWA domain-containing protein [Vicinamibacterales bacterium]
MDTRRALAAATLLAGLAVVGQGQLVAQTIQRALYVSVLNEAGAPVPDLGPSDFIVREDNVAREVLKVAPATEPMQVALLIDNSQAARDYIAHYRQALPAFVTALADAGEGSVRNEVAVIAIAERPTILTDYTTNLVNLKKGIDRLWSQRSSGAYLLDGIYETAKGFKKREAQRAVIVAITAEGPELSNYHYDQVLGPLRDNGVAFYAIAVGHPTASLSDEMRNRAMVLDIGTRDSGGSFDQLLTSMALGGKLTQLADQLTHQYRVTYARPTTLIPPEKVTVAAAKPNLTARGTLIRESKDKK